MAEQGIVTRSGGNRGAKQWPSRSGGVPVLLSSGWGEIFGSLGVVWGGGGEHGVDEVAAAASDADGGGVVVLALVAFALVVRLGVWVVLGGDERSEDIAFFSRWFPRRDALALLIDLPDRLSTGGEAGAGGESAAVFEPGWVDDLGEDS